MAHSSIQVLLVDDHPIVRGGVISALRQAGHGVAGCATTEGDALAAFEALSPDVVVLDIRLAEGSGLEVVRRLRAEHGDAPRVVMFTAHEEPEIVAAAVQAGANGYVTKTVGPTHLVQAIEAVSRGERYLCPRAAEVVELQRRAPRAGQLTPRERQVVELIASGLSSKEIGERLGISWRTVDTHRGRAMRKLRTRNVADLVRWAIASGLNRPNR